MGCPCRGNAHSTRLALCRHFTAFAELFSLLFLVVSFQDSLTLEEPVKDNVNHFDFKKIFFSL